MTEPIVHIRNLSFAHGDSFRLRIPELRLLPAQRLALIGPSGSGKTTLLDLIAGIRSPAPSPIEPLGSIRTLGHDLASLTPHARRALRLASIGMAFQEFELLDYLSARDNILLSTFLSASDPSLRARAEELASAAGVRHVLDRPPAKLSQGERQRIALCRALLTHPKLILCDEPTGNLDPRSASAIIDLLLTQAAATGAAVIVATHDHALLPRFDHTINLAAIGAAA